MEKIPIHFCESVTALWRCCDEDLEDCRCRIPLPSFKAAKWNVSRRINIDLYLLFGDGKWRYGFTNPDYPDQIQQLVNATSPGEFEGVKPDDLILTADELKKRPDLKHMRVENLVVRKMDERSDVYFKFKYFKILDTEPENLMKFTSCLADEPSLCIFSLKLLNAIPAVKKWIEERSFSRIAIDVFTAADQALLDKRRMRGKPTKFAVEDCRHRGAHILADYLASGKLPLFWSSTITFRFKVMNEIIANFLRNPEEFVRNPLDISVCFDSMTYWKLEKIRKNGFCRKRYKYYIFEAGGKRISVSYNPYRKMFRITDGMSN